ncbi:MAG: pyrroline-5-carboxylate reductase [Mariprofundaceae bacterium]|nr:pyrroline-5-carboxylate reductase [Mariprofundaceae bacterium]
MQRLTISFIGGGNMAEALLSGLIRAGHSARRLYVSDVNAARRDTLEKSFGVRTSSDNAGICDKADIIVLAVKPQQMQQALTDLGGHIRPHATVISIAAGVSTDTLRGYLGRDDISLVRVMPNTPALVGAGISALFSEADDIHRERAEYVLAACGEVVWVDDEQQLHAVTAVSGSGPAYFFLLAEVMQAAAVSLGLSEPLAQHLAAQTAAGAGRMLVESGRQAAELRHQVTSPGGTTQAALDVMYEKGFPDAVRQGIAAAHKRSIQLS